MMRLSTQRPIVEPALLVSAAREATERGYVHLAVALDDSWRKALLDCAPGNWRPVPKRVGPVCQTAEECTLTLDFPAPVAAFASAVEAAIAAESRVSYRATEATYMRYEGEASGISPHRDHVRYRILIAIASLTGDAALTIHNTRARSDVLDSLQLGQGDLVFLRGPGLVPQMDDRGARPLHAISAPSGGSRISLSLRMTS